MRSSRVLRITSVIAASAGLMAGFGASGLAGATALPMGHSYKPSLVITDVGNTTTTNKTKADVTSYLSQTAATGDALVTTTPSWSHHKSSSSNDNAATGPASNSSSATAAISVSSSAKVAAVMPSSVPTLPKSAVIKNVGNTTTTSYTKATVTSDVTQTAVSGNATVQGNMSGGSAVTGPASNSSTGNFTISVTNS